MFTVVGYRDVSFKDEKTGREISGTSIYYTSDENSQVTGEMSGKFFLTFRVSNESNYLPTVGDKIKVFYNQFGKVAAIQRLDNKK